MKKYRNKTRPDMGVDCVERLNVQFIKFILWTIKFNFQYKKNLINVLIGEEYEVLKNNKSIDKWIATNFQSKPNFVPSSVD